jgi:hypothetical protein
VPCRCHHRCSCTATSGAAWGCRDRRAFADQRSDPARAAEPVVQPTCRTGRLRLVLALGRHQDGFDPSCFNLACAASASWRVRNGPTWTRVSRVDGTPLKVSLACSSSARWALEKRRPAAESRKTAD